MNTDSEGPTSHLFFVRLWVDDEMSGVPGGHGKVQHVVTGKAISFSSLPALSELILEMAQSKDNLRRSNDQAKETYHEVSDENL